MKNLFSVQNEGLWQRNGILFIPTHNPELQKKKKKKKEKKKTCWTSARLGPVGLVFP